MEGASVSAEPGAQRLSEHAECELSHQRESGVLPADGGEWTSSRDATLDVWNDGEEWLYVLLYDADGAY